MKNFKNLSKMIAIFALAVFALSCNDDDDKPVVAEEQNIVELALGTPELSILVQALAAADGDLVNVLQGDGPFTVLAPTNSAFVAFLNAGALTLPSSPTSEV